MLKPFNKRVSASGAVCFGRIELYPGADVAISVMPPMPTEWWFRPLNSAALVGEQSAVVWKRLNFRPLAARRSRFGVVHGPPNVFDAPKPQSSIITTTTLGAPAGGRTGVMGGNDVFGSLASYVVSPTCVRSGIGSTVRAGWGAAGACESLICSVKHLPGTGSSSQVDEPGDHPFGMMASVLDPWLNGGHVPDSGRVPT